MRIRLALIVLLHFGLASTVPGPWASGDAGHRTLHAPQTAPGVPPSPAPLVERSTVELVLIETYVTDRSGHPIRGLGTEDFVLKIDGYVKPIASVETRVAPTAAQGGPGVSIAAPAAENRALPVPAGSRFARRFVLFFDDETSSPQGLGVARQAAARFLETGLQASDEIAIVAYRHRLRLLQDFTTDRAALRRVLDESYEDPRRHSTFVTESEARTQELRQELTDPVTFLPTNLEPRPRNPLQELTGSGSKELIFQRVTAEENRVMSQVLGALQSLVESLAPWPGYKGIIYLGDGIPENPGRLHLDRLKLPPSVAKNLVDATLSSALTVEFRHLVEAASGAGVTLHSVQTSGLAAGQAGAVAASSRRSNALETLALNTGGIASSSNNLGRALAEVDDGSREYYVIGYAPDGPPDGRYHSIELRVKRGGLRVRWRRGFTRFLPEELQRRTLQAAHLLPGLYAAMQLELVAVPGPPEPFGRTVDLVLHIPPGRLLMLREADRLVARLDVGMVALGGPEETLRLARRVAISVDPAATPADRLGTNLFARVHLPGRAQTITAVISDLATGEVGAARADLPEQSLRPQAVAGLSIYSLAERSLWVEVRESPTITDLVGASEPPNLGPALRTTFSRGEPLACGFRTIAGLSGSLRLRIFTGGSAVREIDVDEAAGPAVRTVRFPTADLVAGDYVLVVEETGPGGRTEVGRVPFAIRSADPGAKAASPS